MAQGDFVIFEEFAKNVGQEAHNFPTDTLKLGIVTNVLTPTAADATPTWTDYSANEVGTGGGYTAGGLTLSSVTFNEADGDAILDAADLSLAQNASGFTNGYWGILYNDTNGTKMAIGFIDLGGPASEVAGPININWNASGILKIAA